MKSNYDFIVFGAGIFGLYAAKTLGKRGFKVGIIEVEEEAFQRASFINQARIHNGYHYPRSLATAIQSIKYNQRFIEEFPFAVNNRFKKIYAISHKNSYISADQFEKFCRQANVPAAKVDVNRYFSGHLIEQAYETLEYSFDHKSLKDFFMGELVELNNVEFFFHTEIMGAQRGADHFQIFFKNGNEIKTNGVINATYAGTNSVLMCFGLKELPLKYELCEVILVNMNEQNKENGFTVMDGPFFSLMPFGHTGFHSLTSVTYTPHYTSMETRPSFPCQDHHPTCSPDSLQNCNTCPLKPYTAWHEMVQQTKLYFNENVQFSYEKSLFTVKTLSMQSEVDDSRPTLIITHSESPKFITILSGKINTIFDLDEVIK
ncbi:FAD-dependent oxidoreductase [Neobacillus dielmonensis]|uniref:FAD-dependent oxidoreductase n=1 Tax=Neobacillus dielmonensis TaxID=1347369 RepID=UPI0005A8D94B|nr:FAD-dependent oxidoreductase [Neobacillus dielmonensis]